MKKLLFILPLTALLFFNSSCDELFDLADDAGLSNEEVVEGLKTALEVGTDSAVFHTSKADGYYRNEIIKVFLPPEADVIVDNLDHPILQAIGAEALVEDVILRINRSAEDAAPLAKDIFFDAVGGLSISDGFKILNGQNPNDTRLKYGTTEEFDSIAATNYLRDETYTALSGIFKPKIKTSLEKPLVVGVSAMTTWNELTGLYNNAANSIAGQIAGLNPVNTELDVWVTDKALGGLFYKVGEEEKKIRRDPFKWALDILQRVFGSVMQ